MLLRASILSTTRLLTKRLASTSALPAASVLPPSQRLHQPLGTVPTGTDPEAVRAKWGSDAMDKIQDVPVIEVDGNVAICNGGGGALGHPVEYIKLLVSDEDAGPQVCKYCGLRFIKKRKKSNH